MRDGRIVRQDEAAAIALSHIGKALALLDLGGFFDNPGTAHLQIAYDQLRGRNVDLGVTTELDTLQRLDRLVAHDLERRP